MTRPSARLLTGAAGGGGSGGGGGGAVAVAVAAFATAGSGAFSSTWRGEQRPFKGKFQEIRNIG